MDAGQDLTALLRLSHRGVFPRVHTFRTVVRGMVYCSSSAGGRTTYTPLFQSKKFGPLRATNRITYSASQATSGPSSPAHTPRRQFTSLKVCPAIVSSPVEDGRSASSPKQRPRPRWAPRQGVVPPRNRWSGAPSCAPRPWDPRLRPSDPDEHEARPRPFTGRPARCIRRIRAQSRGLATAPEAAPESPFDLPKTRIEKTTLLRPPIVP